ncbi:Transposon Ty3-G Gag-Pol polyprotein [Nymphon striatum]|nr:Transposon Ty3-G Gag-Pol polyprotein [Nymphon striatum]
MATAKLRGFKGHLTRAEKELDRICSFVEDNSSPRGISELETSFTKFKQAYSKLEILFDELIVSEIDDKVVDGYEGQLAEYSSKIDVYTKRVLHIIGGSRQVPNSQEGSTTSTIIRTDAPVYRPKICETLKPFKLNNVHTPVDLRNWIAKFKAFHSISNLELYTIEEQHMFLLSCVDPKLETTIVEHDNYNAELHLFGDDSVITILRDIFDLSFPLFNRRLEFFRYTQASGQKFSDFMLTLKQKGEDADLHSLDIDALYVFRYLMGTNDTILRDRFLKLGNPNLNHLKQEVRSYEAGLQAARAMDEDINISKFVGQRKKKTPYHKSKLKHFEAKTYNQAPIPIEMKGKCWTCGSSKHHTQKCSEDKNSLTCYHCGKQGHMSVICMDKLRKKASSSGNISVSRTLSRTHSPESGSDSQSESKNEQANTIYCRSTITASNRPTPKVRLKFQTLDNEHKFEFSATPDTGATRSIIANNILSQHNIPFKSTSCRLFAANGNEMSCPGQVRLKVDSHIINAVVSSDLNNEILISWHDLKALNIIPSNFPCIITSKVAPLSIQVDDIQVDDIITILKNTFHDVLGDSLEPNTVMKGLPMKIHLRSDVKIQPKRNLVARKIPLHFQDKADECIKKLLCLGIIKRVETPTDWVSAGHFVPKPNGTVRLVTDYTNLNEFVRRPIHPFPTGLNIIQRLKCTSKWFAKLDAVFGYFQIPLEEESSTLTTFLIPQGRFRYTRAPMGLNASGDEWCYRSDMTLIGLEGVHKLVDDILIEAETLKELYDRLQNVLVRCREKNIQLSLGKLEIGHSVRFAGHVVSDKGTQPDTARLEAIANFKSPKDITELRSFLGLANQIGQFIPDLAHMTSIIRKLLKKNIVYRWLPEHEIEFQNIKNLLTSDMLVKPFDITLPTELLTDASRLHGLWFCLIQHDKENNIRLISCGSCSLTPTQSRYATIELECLAIQWAIHKCEFWLRGICHFKVVTDHRPLVGVFNKPVYTIENPRLQRMCGKLTGYKFVVEWKAGKDHQIADALSRAPVWPAEAEDDDVDHVQVASVHDAISSATINNLELEFFSKSATTCTAYKQLIAALKEGKVPQNLPTNHIAKCFSKVWNNLSLYDDDKYSLVLLDGHRIVVPYDARPDILHILHLSHQGLVKTKQLARRCYYWPGMNASIKNLIEGCRTCFEFLPSQPQEPILEGTMPSIPMTHVGVDLFEAIGKTYIVMIDRYSGFLFVSKLTNSSTISVINILLKWFYDFGLPDIIRSDGGPCFRSEFREFCGKYLIKHEISSAYNPTSNGLAEAAVKNAKKLVLKCKETGEDFHQALAEFRLMPRADGFSPADLMFGRTPRGLLPAMRTPVDLYAGQEARQTTLNKSFFQHSSKPNLPCLRVGDIVRIQNPKTKRWIQKGSIIASRDNSRSYEVESDGKLFLRNRRYLRLDKTKNGRGWKVIVTPLLDKCYSLKITVQVQWTCANTVTYRAR